MHLYRLSAVARAARAPLTSHHRGAPRGVPGMRPEVVRTSLHGAGMVHAGCGGGAGLGERASRGRGRKPSSRRIQGAGGEGPPRIARLKSCIHAGLGIYFNISAARAMHLNAHTSIMHQYFELIMFFSTPVGLTQYRSRYVLWADSAILYPLEQQ